VNPKGQLLTTWEEIHDCHKVAVLVDYEYRDTAVVAGNSLSGLAVLRALISSQRYAVLRTGAVAEGEEIRTFAHPIQDGISLPLESETGTVRDSTGPDGIEGVFQHTAILDGGGTGGPIVDKSGNVVGIVVHPLSKKWPTAVGYGISNTAIVKFTEAAGIEIWEQAAAGVSNTAMAESAVSDASSYTVPVICFR
jgi:S1-C subfamily serine protease